jgi:cell division protein FtsI/penicillin-binding protein 2
MMVEVVREGTGTSAALPGTRVAGKTGTAELRTTQGECPPEALAAGTCEPPDPNDTSDTTAWFSAFAPAEEARVAVTVMLVGAGAGGQTAAPAAREVIRAALRRG